jgi:hypothetical protein
MSIPTCLGGARRPASLPETMQPHFRFDGDVWSGKGLEAMGGVQDTRCGHALGTRDLSRQKPASVHARSFFSVALAISTSAPE